MQKSCQHISNICVYIYNYIKGRRYYHNKYHGLWNLFMIDVSFLDNLFSTLASSQRKYWREHLREVTKCIKMWTILQIIQLYDKIYDMLECEMLIYRVCKKKIKVANIVLHQICGNHVTRRKGVNKKLCMLISWQIILLARAPLNLSNFFVNSVLLYHIHYSMIFYWTNWTKRNKCLPWSLYCFHYEYRYA